MKRYHFILLAVLAVSKAVAQPADKTFMDVAAAMNKLSSLQYDSYREINNYKDNYFSKNSGTSYFEFDPKVDGQLSRFQLRSEKLFQVYNGTEYFVLNDKDNTYETGKRKVKSLSSISLLYNSIATLRISLPVIAADAGIPKSVKDTLVEGKPYHLLKFELYKKTIEFPSGFSGFEVEVTRYYELLVDKKTLLPYIIIDRNSIMKDQYFTKTIFTSIVAKPEKPVESSWFFSAYSGYSPKPDIKQEPLIAVGAAMPGWVLPEYSGEGSPDSIQQTAFKGKKVMMEFWMKNCGYCMMAFPEMKTLQEKYGKEMEILSVNAYDERKEIDFFYKREKPAYKMLYNGEKLANNLGIYAYPAIVILDEAGKVVYSHTGFNREEIEAALKK
jgi:thiol-disulfide isomerase/thioredoxin